MPLVLILLLAAACMPLPWPRPQWGFTAVEGVWLAALIQVLPVLLGWLVMARVVLQADDPARRPRAVRAFNRARRWQPMAHLLAGITAILAFGWGHTITRWASGIYLGAPYPRLYPAAELLVPGPYLLAVLLGWAGNFFGERALHRTSRAVREGEAERAFWTFPGYLAFHARQIGLAAGLPIGLFVTQQSLIRTFPQASATGTAQVGGLILTLLVFVLLPTLVQPLLGFRPLPPGPVRELLLATRQRLGVRIRRIYFWPTRGAVANAVVLGLVPRLRYIAITDRLIDNLTPAELVGVYGHETGHARHGHLAYYALFLILSASAAAAVTNAAGQALVGAGVRVPPGWGPWLAVGPLVMLGVYLFLVFGWLSRKCERQADVFGARAGSCGNPNCHLHTPETELLRGRELAGTGVCRTGALALALALEHVMKLNGAVPQNRQTLRARFWARLRAWQHGPMSARIAFLHQVAANPELAARADRAAFRARLGLFLVLVATLLAAGTGAGWQTLATDLLGIEFTGIVNPEPGHPV